MPYESKFETSHYENSITVIYDGEDGAVRETAVRSGDLPTKSFQRSGSNNPLNGPLLALLGKSKPLRVRFVTKKVVVGYRFAYKKVFYNEVRPKRVFSHFSYLYSFTRELRVSKRGKRYWANVKKTQRFRHYRYIDVVKVRFRKVKIRIPVKVRVKVPFVVPPKVAADAVTGRPYLLPNLLSYMEDTKEVYPRSNSSSVPERLTSTIVAIEATREGPGVTPFNIAGQNLSSGWGPWFAENLSPFLPPVDDIYLSATALHGLYKKVATDAPSTLTSLAELPEAIGALYRILADGIKLAKSLRHLDARQAYSVVNAAVKARKDSLSEVSSKVWLSWYLAVAPTISDVAEHISFLSREDRVWRKYQKSAKSQTVTIDEYSPWNYYSQINTTTTVKWSCIINGRLTMDQFKSKLQGSDNISAALYAVIPFSFIADWIVDVSAYLESAAIFQGLDYDAWKTSSTSIEEVQKSSYIGYNSNAGARTEKRNSYFHKSFRVDREPTGSLPDMPLIPWKRKLVSETLINRSLTAASLFRVLASKKN